MLQFSLYYQYPLPHTPFSLDSHDLNDVLTNHAYLLVLPLRSITFHMTSFSDYLNNYQSL